MSKLLNLKRNSKTRKSKSIYVFSRMDSRKIPHEVLAEQIVSAGSSPKLFSKIFWQDWNIMFITLTTEIDLTLTTIKLPDFTLTFE